MKFYLKNNGIVDAYRHPDEDIIFSFLYGDIQCSEVCAEFFICKCKNSIEKNGYVWSGTGNSYTVTIKNKEVELFNEYTEEEKRYDVTCFLDYIISWNEFIKTL